MEHSGAWAPELLSHCVDSEFLAYLTAGLAFFMFVNYVVIAKKLFGAVKYASDNARIAWYLFGFIFLVCSIAGYISLDVALFAPKTSVILRIAALSVQSIVCPLFLYYANSINFYAFGKEQAIGAVLLLKTEQIKTMSDSDAAKLLKLVLLDSGERLRK